MHKMEIETQIQRTNLWMLKGKGKWDGLGDKG